MPGRKVLIERALSAMELWIELQFEAVRAFEKQPVDDETLRPIFAYARYCLAASDGDINTAVAVAFVEHLPVRAAVRADLHRWISQEEFDGLRALLQYFPSPEEFEAFQTEFKKRARERRRSDRA
jgi:hypothetical protein